MMFFFKKPEIVVDCFTSDAGLIKVMPITNSNKFMPDWWKKLPLNYQEQSEIFSTSTMKKCKGFIEYYSNSFTIPMWSDLSVNVDENHQFSWQFSDRHSKADIHSEMQRGSYLPSNKYGHIKMVAPWALKTKEDIKWVWSQPTWNFDSPESLIIPPGVLDFKNQFSVNVNMFFNVETPRNFLIELGQPLAHITPLTEKNVTMKRHLVSDDELYRIHSTQTTFSFLDKYSKSVKNQERFSDCPYHKEV